MIKKNKNQNFEIKNLIYNKIFIILYKYYFMMFIDCIFNSFLKIFFDLFSLLSILCCIDLHIIVH